MSETIKIKTSWNEVTLREYLQISEIEFDSNLKGLNITKAIKLVSILSDKTEEELEQYSHEMFSTLFEKISFVYSDPEDDSGEPFEIGGTKYLFHNDWQGMTTGEALSIEQAMSHSAETGETFLPDILVVLIRPFEEVENKETKKTTLKLEKFETENLEFRKQLFMDNLTTNYFLKKLTAFMLGAKESGIISRLSSVRISESLKRLNELNQ